MRHAIEVSGEPLDVLVQLFPYIELQESRNGLYKVEASNVPKELLAPFWRALMRREAKLLLADADEVVDDFVEPRTHDERRADAFGELIRTIAVVARLSDSYSST
jgi:hypothetical protein